MDEQIDILLASYGLERLLEDNDVTEQIVVEMLINEGYIDLEDYFE